MVHPHASPNQLAPKTPGSPRTPTQGSVSYELGNPWTIGGGSGVRGMPPGIGLALGDWGDGGLGVQSRA